MGVQKKPLVLNKRKAIINLLNEACESLPDYSMCDILYSALRRVKPDGQNIGWLRDIGDDKLYSAVDGAIVSEAGK